MLESLPMIVLAAASLAVAIVALHKLMVADCKFNEQKAANAVFITEVRYGMGSVETRIGALAAENKRLTDKLDELERLTVLPTGYYSEVTDPQTGKKTFKATVNNADDMLANVTSPMDVIERAKQWVEAGRS